MKKNLLYFLLALSLPILNVLAASGATAQTQAEHTTIQYRDSQDPSSPSKVVTLPSHGIHQLEDRIGKNCYIF
jgi:hypothetical protein